VVNMHLMLSWLRRIVRGLVDAVLLVEVGLLDFAAFDALDDPAGVEVDGERECRRGTGARCSHGQAQAAPGRRGRA